MEKMIVLVAVLIVLVFVIQALKGRNREAGPAPYYKKAPLSGPEQVLFHRLREALPELIILAQVAMPAMIGIRKNPNWQRQFNEISRKHVDFVICAPDLSLKAIIELDDSTHQRPDRIKSDIIKDATFAAIDVPVIRFNVIDIPDATRIKEAVKTATAERAQYEKTRSEKFKK